MPKKPSPQGNMENDMMHPLRKSAQSHDFVPLTQSTSLTTSCDHKVVGPRVARLRTAGRPVAGENIPRTGAQHKRNILPLKMKYSSMLAACKMKRTCARKQIRSPTMALIICLEI